jgi:hypothetical protein
VILRSKSLYARIDPRHGAEVIDLVDLRTGRQLLGRPPFASALPRPGDLEEDAWTASYRGGWQLLTPNAGAPCEVGERRHGFHGRASNDPWEVVEQAADRARLRWTGHGLVVHREIVLAGADVRVAVTYEAEAPAPLVAVEHIALGIEVLDPDVVIELPAGRAVEMDEREGSAAAAPDAPRWPEVALMDGSTERADRWSLVRSRSRLVSVQDVPEGAATVRNGVSGAGVALAWDPVRLPHLWLWHEVRASGGPWRGCTELLVVEPASVPHHLGLAAAIAHDQATWVQPGRPFGYSVALTALPGEG